jgi:hypothetical protein
LFRSVPAVIEMWGYQQAKLGETRRIYNVLRKSQTSAL